MTSPAAKKSGEKYCNKEREASREKISIQLRAWVL